MAPYMATFKDRDMSLFKWKTQYQKNQCEEAHQNRLAEGREYEAIIYEKKGNITYITLNRPEKMNALNDALYHDMLAGIGEASADPDVRVIVMKGAGRAFCGGHELSSPPGEESPPVDPKYNPTVRDFYMFERRRCGKYEDMQNCPKPIIAQVHGICIGAGEGLQAACDITIAAEDARFGIRGFGRMTTGVVGGIGSFAVGWPGFWPGGSTKFAGGKILPELSGKELAEIGLINKAVPADKLEEEVNRWAEMLSLIPPDLMALAKESVNGIMDIAGWGLSLRTHYAGHIAIQWVKFAPDETNMYKVRRERGIKGFFEGRAVHATPEGGKAS